MKIGWSEDSAERLRTLQTGASHPLQVRRLLHGPRRLEVLLHGALMCWRRKRKWFAPEVLHALDAFLPLLPVEFEEGSPAEVAAVQRALTPGGERTGGGSRRSRPTVESPARAPSYAADRDRLLNRLNRIEGQIRGVRRMNAEGRALVATHTQCLAIKAAIAKVALSLLDDHVRACVTGDQRTDGASEDSKPRCA